MDESNQKRKYMLGLSGEFLVAGELLRREISAAVTYGNAKKADVIAVNGKIALPIEVKTTQEQKWVVGGKMPESNDSIWVLVYLPPASQPA
jgi:predicted AAA+ superfamily ATPase